MTSSLAGRGRDAGWEAHHAAIAHLTACADALDAEEAGEVTEVESPAVGPYCGCLDCEVRETLAAAWPILLDDAAAIAEDAGYTEAAQLLRAETARVRQLLGLGHPDSAA